MERQAHRGIESQETDREGADIHGGRQRNKQLERQTDGETGTQRDRQSRDRQRGGIHTWGRQRNKQLERQADGETGTQRDRESRDRQRGGRHIWGQTKKQTARETDRWRDRQTEG